MDLNQACNSFAILFDIDPQNGNTGKKTVAELLKQNLEIPTYILKPRPSKQHSDSDTRNDLPSHIHPISYDSLFELQNVFDQVFESESITHIIYLNNLDYISSDFFEIVLSKTSELPDHILYYDHQSLVFQNHRFGRKKLSITDWIQQALYWGPFVIPKSLLIEFPPLYNWNQGQLICQKLGPLSKSIVHEGSFHLNSCLVFWMIKLFLKQTPHDLLPIKNHSHPLHRYSLRTPLHHHLHHQCQTAKKPYAELKLKPAPQFHTDTPLSNSISLIFSGIHHTQFESFRYSIPQDETIEWILACSSDHIHPDTQSVHTNSNSHHQQALQAIQTATKSWIAVFHPGYYPDPEWVSEIKHICSQTHSSDQVYLISESSSPASLFWNSIGTDHWTYSSPMIISFKGVLLIPKSIIKQLHMISEYQTLNSILHSYSDILQISHLQSPHLKKMVLDFHQETRQFLEDGFYYKHCNALFDDWSLAFLTYNLSLLSATHIIRHKQQILAAIRSNQNAQNPETLKAFWALSFLTGFSYEQKDIDLLWQQWSEEIGLVMLQ